MQPRARAKASLEQPCNSSRAPHAVRDVKTYIESSTKEIPCDIQCKKLRVRVSKPIMFVFSSFFTVFFKDSFARLLSLVLLPAERTFQNRATILNASIMCRVIIIDVRIYLLKKKVLVPKQNKKTILILIKPK